MTPFPTGSRVNCFTSGGPNGSPRFQIVRAAAQKPDEDAEVLREKLRAAKARLQRLQEEQAALDPGRIYAARQAGNQAEDKPGTALSALPSAADIYATRRVSHDS